MDNTVEIAERSGLGKPVWIRHVLVPGLTLDDVQLHQLGRLLRDYRCIEKVELLPFHKMGSISGRRWASPIRCGMWSLRNPGRWNTPARCCAGSA